MIEFFKKRFALSEQGAKNLRISIFAKTATNITFFFPPIVAFLFLDEYINENSSHSIIFYIILSLALLSTMFAVAYVDYDKLYTTIYKESAKTRINLAEKLRKLPLSFFAKREATSLSGTIMEDVTQFETLFSHSVPQIFASLLSISFVILSLFFYDFYLSLAMFWVVVASFVLFFAIKNIMSKTFKSIATTQRDVSVKIQEGLELISEIKAYSLEKKFLKSLDQKLENYEQELIRGELIGSTLLNISFFILRLGLPSVVLTGAYMYLNGSIDLFKYLIFLVIVSRIYDPFIEALTFLTMLLALDVRLDRIKEINSLPLQQGNKKLQVQNYDIEFRNVSFSYKDGTQTLKNISFTAHQGKITALIGESGGGKSTIAKLAARFWDIQNGTILIGGADISKIEPENLLKYFSIVFQDVVLFNTSVLENIRLGRPDASDEEVKAVAKLAQCDEFVTKLPQGYDTIIGENGEKLSGGERQRLSIARAMLKNAPIILLDEATASLDGENESKVQEALSELVRDKTTLIIAHRMRTIQNADMIVALSGGKIVEIGTPDELEKKNGIYAKMKRIQSYTQII